MEKGIKLGVEKVELYKENEGYYLRISIIVKEGKQIFRRIYPKVPLGTFIGDTSIREDTSYSFCSVNPSHKLIIDGNDFLIETGYLKINGIKHKCLCKSVLINEEVKEMTIEDIEKKLGYKVKIVGKGE